MPKHNAVGTNLGLPSSAVEYVGRAGAARPLIERLEGRALLSANPVHAHLHAHPPAEATAHATRIPKPPTSAPALQTIASTAATSPLAGDANLDGTVDLSDLLILTRNFGKTNATWAMGDFNADGTVGLADFTVLAENYGKTWNVVGPIPPPAPTPPSGLNWSGPITITGGGTYTGNWESLDPNTPAVSIQTSQPVVLINCNVQSKSTLIESSVGGANVTIKNTHGWALNPDVYARSPGRFLDAEDFSNLDIENNTMVGTAGIEMGYWQGGGTVKVLYNNALNIDGRWSDGNGGFLTGPDQNDYVQFAQFNADHAMAGAEIAWNQVVNHPGQSRPEDNISVFDSSGTSTSPILIHDNYIQGAYAADPANDSSYTGGGIMLSDGSTGSLATEPGYVSAYNNIIVSTSDYGIAVSSGHDDTIYDNTVISSGLLPTGQKIAAQNVGIYVWNSSNDPDWSNNQEYGNTVGWMGPSGPNDTWTPDASGKTGDTFLPAPITLAEEQSYYNVWATKVGASGYIIGAS